MQDQAIERMFEELESNVASTRFAAAKSLLRCSQDKPQALLPFLDSCAALLKHANSIFRWTAMDCIANMACVDASGECLKYLPSIERALSSSKLISINHALAAIAKIADVYADQRRALVKKLLSIDTLSFETEECREIARGVVIELLGKSPTLRAASKQTRAFAERAEQSRRPATQKKARRLLKLMSKT